jgi:hypothetical protein
LREAATRGLESPEIVSYLDSVFELAGHPPGSDRLRDAGGYRNVEQDLLLQTSTQEIRHSLGKDEGLALVRAACEELESQVETHRTSEAPAVEASPL